jgi:hypothetical protein
MLKDDGTGISLQLGGNGDGAAERLVGSHPGPLLANIICGRRDAARKPCGFAAMSTPTTTTVQMKPGGSK